MSETPDPASRAPDGDSLPHRVLVHFLGGPWHESKGWYVRLHHLGFPHMHCPGGRYHFLRHGADGSVVYTFAPA